MNKRNDRWRKSSAEKFEVDVLEASALEPAPTISAGQVDEEKSPVSGNGTMEAVTQLETVTIEWPTNKSMDKDDTMDGISALPTASVQYDEEATTTKPKHH